ncbi:MAG: histidine phosphatase family protein [Chloroflexota bacterium]|nr:histidine phosphatase family protein [Chloroflexota bacterium]
MVTLVLTRHGATTRSEPEQHLGQRIDIELSPAGREAAGALAMRLEGVQFERVISSPLRRAQETAVRAVPGATIETDTRLAEMDYGEWEGLTYEQIDERDAELRDAWERDPATLACPGGESGADVARRVHSFLDELVEWGEGSGADGNPQVLAVAHSTTNRILLAVSLGVPLRDYRLRFRQDPANLTVLRFAGLESGALLLVANDVAHIKGVRGRTWG